MRRTLILFCAVLWTTSTVTAQKKIVCSWTPRAGVSGYFQEQFLIENLDATICTHLIYSGIINDAAGGLLFDEMVSDQDYLTKFANLRIQNSEIILLLGLGGEDQGKDVFHTLGNLTTSRGMYVNNVKAIVDQYNLDGIDFDWQYPGYQEDWISTDRINYINYLSGFRTALGSSKIISVSVAARPEDIAQSYDIPAFINLVDFINLKTYNMRGTPVNDNSITAFHSPLYKRSSETLPESEWNVQAIVDSWNREAGVDISDKLIIGVATFGRSFSLVNAANAGVGAPSIGEGNRGVVLPRFARFNGMLAYREICRGIKNSAWTNSYDYEQAASYSVVDDQWVGYDSIRSAINKIEYASEKQLGGVNFIRLELEDFANECGEGTFPLVNWAYKILIQGASPPDFGDPVPSSTSTVESTIETTTESLPSVTSSTESTSTSTIDPTTSTSDFTTISEVTESTTEQSTESSTSESSTTFSNELSTETTSESSTETTTSIPVPPITPPLSSTESTISSTQTTTFSDSTIELTESTTSSNRFTEPSPSITPSLTTSISSLSTSTTIVETSTSEDTTTTSLSSDSTSTTIENSSESTTTSIDQSSSTETPSTTTSTTTELSQDTTSTTESTIQSSESTTSDFTAPTPPVTPLSSTTTSTGEVSSTSSNPNEETSTIDSSTTTSSIDEETSTLSSDSSSDLITPTPPVTPLPTTTSTFEDSTTTSDPNEVTSTIDSSTTSSSVSDSSSTLEETTTTFSPDEVTSTIDSSTTSIENEQTTTTTTDPLDGNTAPTPPLGFICPIEANRNFRHPHDCTLFITCVHGILYVRECYYNIALNIILHYDEDLDQCVWPHETDCESNGTTSTDLPSESTSTIEEMTTENESSTSTQNDLTSSNSEATTSDQTTSEADFETPPNSPPINFFCPIEANRNFRHPHDCALFITCVHGIMYIRECPYNLELNIILYYDENLDQCVWQNEVECITDELTSTTSSGEITSSSTITTSNIEITSTSSTVQVTTTTPLVETSTSEDTTSSPDFNTPPAGPPPDFVCPNDVNGNFPHPHDCTKFIMCVHGIMYTMTCINSVNGIILHYDPVIDSCVNPWETDCQAS